MKKHSVLAVLLCTMMAAMTACSDMENETHDPMLVAPQEQTGGDNMEWNEMEMPNQEEYNAVKENAFILTAEQPVSTFSADVDTASYSNVRRMIRDSYGSRSVDPNAVRIEEMINYFSYDYPEPEGDAPLSVTPELYDCPWNPEHQLLLLGLQAEKLDLSERAPMNLVFLIDVSGSMYTQDKLPLVQQALSMLAGELNENDRISIVTYAGEERVVLEGVSGSESGTITDAIYDLSAGGSTAGEKGIVRAYEIASQYFIEGGNNRVMLATDGDLNVGLSSEEELKKLIEEKRETGVFLSVLGFGTGNLKDDRLETLADNGNGSYAYIDSVLEAKKVLVQEMGGTLYTVAKDVKLQAEFDPDVVRSYRLVGYENRLLANEDFDNDKVDAGEIGAGHSVTALYEIELTQPVAQTAEDAQLLDLSIRCKAPDSDTSQLWEYPVTMASRGETIGKNLAFAAAVAEFGMLLGGREPYQASYEQIQELLAQTDMQDSYRQEFQELTEVLK